MTQKGTVNSCTLFSIFQKPNQPRNYRDLNPTLSAVKLIKVSIAPWWLVVDKVLWCSNLLLRIPLLSESLRVKISWSGNRSTKSRSFCRIIFELGKISRISWKYFLGDFLDFQLEMGHREVDTKTVLSVFRCAYSLNRVIPNQKFEIAEKEMYSLYAWAHMLFLGLPVGSVQYSNWSR